MLTSSELLFVLIAITLKPIESANIDIGTSGNYDYGKVIHASLLFYEAQRSGKLPAGNRIPWRRNSFLDDRGDNGEDLTGEIMTVCKKSKFSLIHK
jgi:hypothetical protein